MHTKEEDKKYVKKCLAMIMYISVPITVSYELGSRYPLVREINEAIAVLSCRLFLVTIVVTLLVLPASWLWSYLKDKKQMTSKTIDKSVE